MTRLFTVFFALLLAGSVMAQETLTLTLERSVNMALENNPEYQKQRKEVAKARASVTESYSSVLPQVSVNANFQRAWAIQENTIPNFIKVMLPPTFPGVDQMPDFVRISFGLENTLMYGATLQQPLFLGGAGMAGIRMAKAAYQASEENLEMAEQELLYNVASAFYGSILAKEVVTVQEEALQQAQENYDIVKTKYDAGAASKFDLMRAEVNVANTRPDAITARNNYKNSLTRLKMMLALDMDTQLDVNGNLLYEDDAFTNLTLAEYQNMALQNRPELAALQSQKVISRQGVTMARSNFLPKLFFQTDYSYMGMKNDLKFTQDDFSKGFTSAISLQLPLFTGLKNNRQYHKSKLDYQITLDTEEQVTDGIAAEVEAVYHKLLEAKEKFMSANETVELAEESFRLATMMYEEGTNTQLDVFTAQLGLTEARLNYLSSLYEYQMARYALRKVTGQLDGIV